jgi:ankyrin repeat protein
VDPKRRNREVDPSARNNFLTLPIRIACSEGYAEILGLLLNDRRVNPSDYNNQALIKAVSSGSVETVRVLMDYGNLVF